jgi:hypothetical protein
MSFQRVDAIPALSRFAAKVVIMALEKATLRIDYLECSTAFAAKPPQADHSSGVFTFEALAQF